jgi:hypothetical protein
MNTCPKCGSKDIYELIVDGPLWLEDGSLNSNSLGSCVDCSSCGYRPRKRREKLTVVEPRFSGYDNVVDLDDEKSRRSFNKLLKDLSD